MDASDTELMQEYQMGNAHAVQQLFQRYHARILNFCFRLLGNRADAEEASGDVFLALIAQKDGYEAHRTFSTWLYTIARNKCVDQWRKRRRLLPLWWPGTSQEESAEIEVPDAADPAWERMAKQEVAARIQRALRKLPYAQREALVLKQYHDLSYAEISEVLHCSLENVRSLIFRAKERLRLELVPILKEDRR